MPDHRSVELTASLLATLRATLSAGAVVVPEPSLAADECGVPEGVSRRILARRPGAGLVLVSRPEGAEPGEVGVFRVRRVGGGAVALSPSALVRLGARPGEVVRVHALLAGASRREAVRRLGVARRPHDGSLRPLVSPDARLGLAYLALRVDGERGEAPRPEAPPCPGERDDRAAWDGYARAVRRWQLSERGRLEGFFASDEELRRAFEAGEVAAHAGVFVRRAGEALFTTPGRSLIEGALAGDEGEGGAPWEVVDERWAAGPAALDRALAAVAGRWGDAAHEQAGARLERLGLAHATRSGVSLALDHLPTLPERHLRDAHEAVAKVSESFEDGLITDGERYTKVVDVWSDASERALQGVSRELQRQPGEPIRPAHVLSMMLRAPSSDEATTASSRSRRMLAFFLTARPSGEILEVPVRENLRVGVGPHGAMMMAAQARRHALEAGRHERWLGSLRERLLRALGDVRVVTRDCGSVRPLWAPLLSDSSGEATLARAAGRTLSGSVRWRGDGDEGERPDEATLARWLAGGLWQVPIRSPVTCEAEGGVCAVCMGEGPRGGERIGAPVGLWAAQAISLAARSLSGRRSFWGLGAAGRPLGRAREPGVVAIEQADARSLAINSSQQAVVMGSGVAILLLDDEGNVAQREPLQRGDVLLVEPGERVSAPRDLAHRDDERSGRAVLAEADGRVRWCDITSREEADRGNGLSRRLVEWRPGDQASPRLVIEGPRGEQVVHWLDDGAELRLDDGARVQRGDVLAWLAPLSPSAPREDILDGVPTFDALLRVRPVDGGLVLSEVSGDVSLETVEVSSQGRRWRRVAAVIVTPRDERGGRLEGLAHRHELPEPGLVLVQEGEAVSVGDVLVDGFMDPRQLLRIRGPGEAARWMLDRLHLVLAWRGEVLRPAHAELLVRALLGFVRVTSPGDGPWAPGERVRWTAFCRQNEAIEARGGRPARAEAVVTNLARVRGEAVSYGYKSTLPPETTR